MTTNSKPVKDPVGTEPTEGQAPADASTQAQGLAIVARTQAQLVRRRFFRHRAAMISLTVLILVILLAFTSIGWLGIPGWWIWDYTTPGIVVNRGAPTLSVLPEFLGGDGFHIGLHPFGQDDLGRDYFALTMRGAQISILIAFVVGIVSTIIGVIIGSVSGFFGSWVEGSLMRFTDVIITIPVLVIAAVLGQRFGGSGPLVLAVVLGLVVWTSLARLVRGEFLSLREKEFVEAARALGAKPTRIIFRHILPNTVGVITVAATLTVAAAILLETALSYLGFGVRAPDTSLGLLVSTYQNAFVTRPWLFWWPGLFIIIIALSINFIGDGLRDAFDPRQNRVRA